jgi:hypothetical protein
VGHPGYDAKRALYHWFRAKKQGEDLITMIDLLIRVGYILLVLAVISLFVCTLPIWLIVLVVVLLG